MVIPVTILSDLVDGKRLIGIISHVHDLEERIDKQIIVSKTLKGSKIDTSDKRRDRCQQEASWYQYTISQI